MVKAVFSQVIVEVQVSTGAMREDDGSCCAVCPALLLQAGAFDVIDRPSADSPYDADRDCRVNVHTGAPTCVHPFRVGLPVGAYASEGVPVPGGASAPSVPSAAALELPELEVDLEAWLVARIAVAETGAAAAAIGEAEAAAGQRFPGPVVVAALRRVLSHHLAA